MNAELVVILVSVAGGLWVMRKVGLALTKLLEAAAAVAVVFVTAWLVVKGLWKAGRWMVRHWRSTIAAVAVLAWLYLLGWVSFVVTAVVVAAFLGFWRWANRETFEPWPGRLLRGWWQRWMVYGRQMPGWLRACGLTVADPGQPVTVQVSPFRRSAVQPKVRPRRDQVPQLIGVRSGPSWDEVKVRLVPGQTPEDFDQAARALAVASGSTGARCGSWRRTWCRSTSSGWTGSPTWCSTARCWRSPRSRGARSTFAESGAAGLSTAPTGRSPSPAATP